MKVFQYFCYIHSQSPPTRESGETPAVNKYPPLDSLAAECSRATVRRCGSPSTSLPWITPPGHVTVHLGLPLIAKAHTRNSTMNKLQVSCTVCVCNTTYQGWQWTCRWVYKGYKNNLSNGLTKSVLVGLCRSCNPGSSVGAALQL